MTLTPTLGTPPPARWRKSPNWRPRPPPRSKSSMALTIETTTDKKINLDELLEYLRNNFDASDPDGAFAAAEPFRALANNEKFLTERLNNDLLKWDNFQIGNDYT